MKEPLLPVDLLSRLCELVRAQTGLDFPPARLAAFQRGFAASAKALGFARPLDCVEALLAAPPTREAVESLAEHLTVRETYFFRHPAAFRALTETILPALVAARTGREQHLRLWSAGCATGEEAYSLAISARRCLPDGAGWTVAVLGTDISPRSREHALRGRYREWSFRGARQRVGRTCFTKTPDGWWEVDPRVRRLVAFADHNLITDPYPSADNGTSLMDVVFCCNTLMYFAAHDARSVVGRLERCLAPGGWLVLSPIEAVFALGSALEPISFDGMTLFRKGRGSTTPHSVPRAEVDALRTPAEPSRTQDELENMNQALLAANAEANAEKDRLVLSERRERTEREAASQDLESFMYSVSHDLRAPLRQISGFAKILAEDYAPSLDATARHYLERVRDGATHMGRLIDDLLKLSRVGRRDFERQHVDLEAVIERVIAVLDPEAAGRRIDWRIGPLTAVDCDPGLVEIAFTNLLSNALKYTRRRSQADVEVGETMVGDERVIFVRDNGAGFDMKYADKLFGVFQRLHSASEFEGNGIGLATVHRIVKKHGGRIWAEAEVDKGATFYFTLDAGRVPQTATA